MWITFKTSCPTAPPISIGLTGCICTERSQMEYTCLKYCQESVQMDPLSPQLSPATTYITKIRPVLEYASPVWGGLPIYLEKEL